MMYKYFLLFSVNKTSQYIKNVIESSLLLILWHGSVFVWSSLQKLCDITQQVV
jgi:hypothetical protein